MAREYEGIANALASRGRNGDSMLMHVSPAEIQYLEWIAPQIGVDLPGGKLPLNPDTGQPEAFFFLLGLLGAIPSAIAAGAGAALGGTAIGSAITGSLAASVAPLAGMFSGTAAGLSGGIIGPALTSALGIGGTAGTGTAGAAAAGGALSGEALGSALSTGEIIAQNAPALAEIGELGATAGELGGAGLEAAATGGLEGGFEALPSMLGETGLTGVGETGVGFLPEGASGIEAGAGTDLAYTAADAIEFAEAANPLAEVSSGPYYEGSLGAQAGPDLAPELPSFMEKVQSGLEAFGENPLQETMNLAGKAGEYALENPIKTAGGIYALDALTADEGGDEVGPGKTWEEGQEGDGDPFLMGQLGGGGGGMTPGREFIVESGVPDRLYPSPSDEMLSGMPGAQDDMFAGRGGAMEEGIGMMPVGPDMAAPVGIAGREIPGQEEALAMFQEGDFGEEMSIEEMIEGLPPGMTIEDMEELWAMYGPDVMRGMV